MLLNVRHPMGMDVLKRLIAESDVVVENFSSGVMESLGARLPAAQGDQARTSSTARSPASGTSGRDKDFTTWGPTAQALCGLTSCPGCPGKPPAGWGYSYMDHTAGYYGAIAILMALHHRNQTGEGQHIDISQVEAGMVLNGPAVLDYTVNGRELAARGHAARQPRLGAAVAPHNTYRAPARTAGSRSPCMNDAEWQALVRAMDEPEWAARPEVRDERRPPRAPGRDSTRDIAPGRAEFDDYEVMALLQAAGVRAGVCQKPGDRFETRPAARSARLVAARCAHGEIGRSATSTASCRSSRRRPGSCARASPLLGAGHARRHARHRSA